MNSTIILTTFTAPKYTTPRHNAIYCYRTVNTTLYPSQNIAPRDVTAKLTRSVYVLTPSLSQVRNILSKYVYQQLFYYCALHRS